MTLFSFLSRLTTGCSFFAAGGGILNFSPDISLEKTVVVQNLRNIIVSIDYIGFADAVDAPDNNQFEILDVLQLPIQLSCGDSIQFRVKWNSPSPPLGAVDAVGISASSGTWRVLIYLKGHPPAG
ncbi:MAG: hypothetical protein GTN73_10065 [Candidatus Aminicenantes bacterium]|nr:hypothetical protein [Candidatus Aminicenantes bacterium]